MRVLKSGFSLLLASVFIITGLFSTSMIFVDRAKALDFINDRPRTENTSAKPEIQEITTVNSKTFCVKIQEGWFNKVNIYEYPSTYSGKVLQDSSGKKFVLTSPSFFGSRVSINNYSASNISLVSADGKDSNYATAANPSSVYKKRKPNGGTTLVSNYIFSNETRVFITMRTDFKEGCAYTVNFSSIGLYNPTYTFIYDTKKLRSEAVHVSQVGFNPTDTAKVAYLSLWMGDGGAVSFSPNAKFEILDANTRQTVYSGTSTQKFTKDTGETYVYYYNTKDPKTGETIYGKMRNFSKTSVNNIDFSSFNTPGEYVVYVEGVGCSYPFKINANVWTDALKVSMKGYLHQRSGIAFDKSFADFERPAPYLPSSGMKIYQSNATLVDSVNGWTALAKTPSGVANSNNFVLLKELCTDEIAVDNTGSPLGLYGGYFDAGDWDRRAEHLDASLLQCELMIMYPDYFRSLKLSLPANEAIDNIPDTLNEVLWNLDLYKRLQTVDGGIRGGIEAEEHPNKGEPSWMESLKVMAYAPDAYSSFIYAACAARVAYIFSMYSKADSSLSQYVPIYLDSAVRAYNWGLTDLNVRIQNASLYAENINDAINVYKIYAAADLYRATGDTKYNNVFVSEFNTNLDKKSYHLPYGITMQCGAAYLGAEKAGRTIDSKIKETIVGYFVGMAEYEKTYCNGNAFNIVNTTPIIHANGGFFNIPKAYASVRANYWLDDSSSLSVIVKSCQWGLGGNQNNLCFTTKLGANPIKGPFYLDVWYAGKEIPAGISPGGPNSYYDVGTTDYWLNTTGAEMYPALNTWDWPEAECYTDAGIAPSQNEYTIHEILGGQTFVWGFLAAHESSKQLTLSTEQPKPFVTPTPSATVSPTATPAKVSVKTVALKSLKPTKLSTKTKKITGISTSGATIKLMYGKKLIKGVKVAKSGKFTLTKFSLEKYKKKVLSILASKSKYKTKTIKFAKVR